jgi:hypothetical protein
MRRIGERAETGEAGVAARRAAAVRGAIQTNAADWDWFGQATKPYYAEI